MGLGNIFFFKKNKTRKPDFVLVNYCVLNANYLNFSPSMMYSAHDVVLNKTFISQGIEFAIEKSKKNDPIDCYLSPFYTPDCILEKYPKITFGVCGLDPFCDSCFIFASRLLSKIENKKDVAIKFFPNMVHGALDAKDYGFNHATVYYEKTNEVIKNFLKD